MNDRINWIGIGPRKSPGGGRRGPLVTFDHFLLPDQNGPQLRDFAQLLARYMYETNRRQVMSNALGNQLLLAEIQKILDLARNEVVPLERGPTLGGN